MKKRKEGAVPDSLEASTFQVIAYMRSDFPDKFGVPRQSGLIQELKGQIVFEQAYRNQEAFRGLEDFSHIWLLWGFSENAPAGWSPTVRPPRLGGNQRLGVFATRSPFRPNPIGLSCVRLDGIDLHTPDGPILHVSGGDLMDGTPIYDIKPYLPFTDSIPEAKGGFAQPLVDYALEVEIPAEILKKIPSQHLAALQGILSHDPRPAYQQDPDRVYGLDFADMNIQFQVTDRLLKILAINQKSTHK